MATKRRVESRTFFLNETHELSLGEKGGGGRLPKFHDISWDTKGRRISESLTRVVDAVAESSDPLRDDRFFVVANPVEAVSKRREDKQGTLKEVYEEKTEYGSNSKHSRTFDRLGLDLLQVTDDGRAIVHADRAKIESLRERTAELADLGPQEQSRWATVDAFTPIPLELRVDGDWVGSLSRSQVSDVIFELQPVLRRLEADTVLRAIAELLGSRSGESLSGTGTDYSGRHWLKAKAGRASIGVIARDFYSVQAIHPPLYSIAAGKKRRGNAARRSQVTTAITPIDLDDLPCVAVVDLGVPDDHKRLAAVRRGRFVPAGAAPPPVGSHGSLVASRVVFGDCQSAEDFESRVATCSFYDAMVGDYPQGSARIGRVYDKVVLAAMTGVTGSAPDVRVFNLSFGDTRPLAGLPEVERRERLLDLQDLDNFAFQNDALIIVAAGNSKPGELPAESYPDHVDDPRWALGPWACGFNTLICGAFVASPSVGGLGSAGWPSPLTRIGPGLCECPVPSFGASGGSVDKNHQFRPGLGVWCLSDRGLAEDYSGTSFAAPLLAREAAFTLKQLEQYCERGTRPFAVTARAFLVITATPPVGDERVEQLTKRTLGYGTASVERLRRPTAGSAVILWQGYIESPKDVVRVRLPVPLEWLNRASEPRLRLVVCSDPPANAAAPGIWACRRVDPKLRPGPDARAVSRPRGEHGSYPTIDRLYQLNKHQNSSKDPATRDEWLIELSYENVASYAPANEFDPRQRVAFAAELFDEGEEPLDPQPALQALPIAATMNRLSIQSTEVRTPIVIRTR